MINATLYTYTDEEFAEMVKHYQELVMTDKFGMILKSIGTPTMQDVISALKIQRAEDTIKLCGKLGENNIRIHRNIYDDIVVRAVA